MPTRRQMDDLLEFIDSSPSPPPPVFVGRRDVIGNIEKRLPYLLKTSGRPKETGLIYGAPGAGKSSILAELERRGAGNGKYNVLVINSERLNDMKGMMKSLSVAAGLSSSRWRDTLLESAARGTAGAIRSVTGISGIRDAVDSLIGGIGGIPQTMTEFEDRFPGSSWQMPLIVAIDEVQRFRWTVDSDQAFFIQTLHDNDLKLPILPVCAGLGDLQDTLSIAGLTRIENIHEIGCLTMDEMDDFFIGFSRKFGLIIGEDSDIDHVIPNINRLMRDSNGLPRHLHHSFQVLGNAARLVDGNLSMVNWSHVHEDALTRRQAYCLGQTSEEMQESVNLTSAIMLGVKDGMDFNDLDELIDENIREEHGWRPPENMTVRDFRHHLVHKGALQQRVDKTFYCPIPSFQTFLIDRTKDPELRKKAERLAMAERKAVSDDSGWSPPEPKPYDDGSFGYSSPEAMDDALVADLVAGPRDAREAWIAVFGQRLKESREAPSAKVVKQRDDGVDDAGSGKVRQRAENAVLQDGTGGTFQTEPLPVNAGACICGQARRRSRPCRPSPRYTVSRLSRILPRSGPFSPTHAHGTAYGVRCCLRMKGSMEPSPDHTGESGM